jgi:pentatricopeptide repeat protein
VEVWREWVRWNEPASHVHDVTRLGVQVTYQKLYKIYLRDARVEEADEVLKKMRQLMQADGATGLVLPPTAPPVEWRCTVANILLLLSFSSSTHRFALLCLSLAHPV